MGAGSAQDREPRDLRAAREVVRACRDGRSFPCRYDRILRSSRHVPRGPRATQVKGQ
jgi:hypothetical protein